MMAIAVAFSWFKFIAAEKQLEADKKAQIELRNSGEDDEAKALRGGHRPDAFEDCKRNSGSGGR